MDTDKKITRTITVNATIATVWDTITNPAKTVKYMFNCAVHSDWTVGSPIIWKGNYQGYESGERGIILICEPNKELKYSSIDPNFGIEVLPINYLHIAYQLEVIDYNNTQLTIVIENFNDDKNRLIHVAQGWDTIVMPALIHTIENPS